MKSCRHKGFTIIELVIVIVLLGIVAAVVFSRFMGPSGFEQAGARDAVISIARGAQQLAMGRNDVTFEIDNIGSNWVFSARAGGNVLRRAEVPANNLVLETGSTAAGGTCAAGLDTPLSNDFVVTYDRQGNATTFTNGGAPAAVDNGVRICINDSTALSVCISPGGFAYQGDCVD